MEDLYQDLIKDILREALEASQRFQNAVAIAHSMGYHVSIHKTRASKFEIELTKEPKQ